MKRGVTILCALLLLRVQFFAQNPLEESFRQIQKSKMQTQFSLPWVSLGPVINSARVESIQLDHQRPGTFYVAFGSGNLWKTTNHGVSWNPIFENLPSHGIGDIALAPSNPEVIYIGTRESLRKQRNFTLPGNGIYRSSNGGESWEHRGLDQNWHCGEIVVHPENPDIVFVAAMGKFWSPGSDQGIYKSSNGGISWKKVLYVNERTRANDIVIAPSKPSVLYATMWENNIDTTLAESVYGPASAVYKSEDLGEHWIRMSNGLPSGPRTGRMGVTVSYTNPDIAYVLVDNLNKARDKASEIYKTEDGGKSWKRTHEDDLLFSSVIGWYFTDIYINPQDDQEIFALGVRIAHSLDGGRTFSYLDGEVQHINPSPAQTLHLDQCEFWIDPLNSEHIAVGNDGGFYQSYDKGSHWIHYNNIPAGEFYTITLDEKNTYEIYGGTQDDATVFGPPREYLGYGPDDWQYLWIDAWSGGDGCITQLDPDDQNIIYFSMQEGYVMRLDRSSGDATPVRPKPEVADFQNQAYNFVTPYFISEHQGQTLYHAGNYVYKSIDRGDNWQCISPDLSNSGVRAKKSVAASALTESPLQAGLLFVGTDHGAFWLSTDDGNHWEERSTGLANNYIRSIAPSNFKHDRLYVSMTGLDYDDQNVCLYRSDDLGQHWQSISSSLPNQPANVVLEDPNFEDIVYVGMHRGVFISLDRGENWQVLGTDFPMVPVADLKINKADELIVATHGRGIYKIDLSPIYFLRKVKPGLPDDKTYLFPVLDFKAAKRRASHHDVDLASIIKQNFYYYLDTSGIYELVIQRLSNENIWQKKLDGRAGLNCVRFDHVIGTGQSLEPYFIETQRFISPGSYQLVLRNDTLEQKQFFSVK